MIQTVKGRAEKADFIKAFGKKWLDRDLLARYAADVLINAKKEYNIGLIVDGTPIDLGRDISLLKKVSEESGVEIVASSGFYWFPSFEFTSNDARYIGELIIHECENGMEETGIKPDILKCAAGYLGFSNEISKRFN